MRRAGTWLPLTLIAALGAGCSLLVDTDPYQGGDAGPAGDGQVPEDVPTAPEVRIVPADPVTTDALRMEIVTESTDPLGLGPVTYEIEWLRDDGETGETGETVAPDRTSKGETWEVRVTPLNADGTPGPAGTASVTIGNLPPSLSYLGLSDYRPVAGDVLSALIGPATDPDEEAVAIDYQWLLDGSPIDGETGQRLTLDPSALPAGSRIGLRATPRDLDDATGEPLETGEAVVVADVTRWRQLLPNRLWERGTAIHDARNRRVLMFYDMGTRDAPDVKVWEYALEPSGARWIELHPGGTAAPVGTATWVVDEANRRVLFFGGFDGDTPTNRLVAFEMSERGGERWVDVSPSGSPPPPLLFPAMAYDGERQQLLLFGGATSGSASDAFFRMDLSRPGFESWEAIDAPTPGGLAASALVIDEERDRAILAGGISPGSSGDAGVAVADLHTLDLTDLFAGFTAVGAALPSPLWAANAAVDPERDRALLAYGVGDGEGAFNSNVFAIDLETFATSVVETTGDGPSLGGRGFLSRDPYGGDFVVFPGSPYFDGGDEAGFSLYALDPASGAYESIVRYGVDDPPALAGAGASGRRRILMWGGQLIDYEFSDQAWLWDEFAGTWSRVETLGDAITDAQPAPRANMVVESSSPYSFDLTFFGGRNTTGRLGSTTWTLQQVDDTRARWIERTLVPSSPQPPASEGVTFFNPACGAEELGYFGGETDAGLSDETGFLRCPTGDRLRECEWHDPVGTQTRPPARSFATASRGSIASVVVLFGGRGPTQPFNDVWTLNPCSGGTEPWIAVTPSGTAPAERWGHSMTLQPRGGPGDLQRYVVFGGFATRDASGAAHSDVFRLTRLGAGTYEWEAIEVASGPDDAVIPGRGRHVAVLDEDDGELKMLVYGGERGGMLLSDLWQLRIVP
jgi:hypothetical protein